MTETLPDPGPSAAPAPQGSDALVSMQGISIEFPGVKALDDVSFRLLPGEVHALLGENGAGKSTLIKALTGVYAIDSGRITVGGQELRFSTPGQAQAAGISTVYQEVNLCENLSVAENVMLGHEVRRAGLVNWRATRRAAREHLRAMNLDIEPSSSLSEHSLAVQQLVAICRAMVIDAHVLVLDEPTSSLDADEVAQLFGVLRGLRQRGVAILFVSHFLDQVYEISDRMTVLRNGRLVGEYLTAELPRVELVQKMIGRSLEALDQMVGSPAPLVADRAEATPYLSAVGLGRRRALQPVDLEVHAGEVVGLAGLLGSGRTEFARLVYGADHADHGHVLVEGAQVRIRSPRAAMAHRIIYSSESRKSEGIIGDLTVRENIVLGIQAERGWIRRVSRRRADEVVERYIELLEIRPANPDMLAGNLSGGNQQKVLLARWLATDPKLLLLDEPTRGIDVGAKAEIQRLIADLATRGLAVLFISAEPDEVLRLSHRIAVMRDRAKIGEIINSPDITNDDIVSLIASGGAA
jgi:monosaccharide-transporting ATPase